MKKYIWFLLGLLISFLTIPSYASAVTWNECVVNPAYGTLGPNSCGTYVAWPVSDSSYYWLFSSPTTATKNTQTPSNYALYAQTCTEPEPDTCSDLIISGNETGLDCGDPACIGDEVCTEYCPSGFHLETRTGGDGFTAELCYSDDDSVHTIPTILDQCPDDMFKSSTDPTKCISMAFQTYASHDYYDAPPAPPAPPEPPNLDNPWSPKTTLQTVNVTNNTVTNTDGSSTTTTTTTTTTHNIVTNVTNVNTVQNQYTTNVDNSTTNTTTNTNTTSDNNGNTETGSNTIVETFDPDGILIGTGGSGYSEDTDPHSDIEDQFSGAGGIGQEGIGEIERKDGTAIDFSPITAPFNDTQNGIMTKFPFSTVLHVEHFLDTWIVTPQAPQIELELPIRTEPFVMDMSLLNPLAGFLRSLLAFSASITGAYVVIRTWRG
jgi:ferredoxin